MSYTKANRSFHSVSDMAIMSMFEDRSVQRAEARMIGDKGFECFINAFVTMRTIEPDITLDKVAEAREFYGKLT